MVFHILIIDDQINLPRFIAMELRAEGYQVSIGCDEATGLSMIRESKPDLIVLNWEIRHSSGPNIHRRLKAIAYPAPIVIITTNDESSCWSAFKLEAQTRLTKPFSMNDLLKTIDYHLQYQTQPVGGACLL